MKIIKTKFFIIIIFVIVSVIYYFPFQYFLAQKNFEEYIKLQGVQSTDISYKKITKNYKQDGYYIDVIYKNDKKYLYSYKFSTNDIRKIFSYESISCEVYNDNNVSIEVMGEIDNIKYPPLKGNR